MIATNVICNYCKTVTAQKSLRFIVQLRQNDVNTVSYFLVWRLYCLIRSTATVVIVCVKAKPRNGAQRRTTAQRHTTAPLCRCAPLRGFYRPTNFNISTVQEYWTAEGKATAEDTFSLFMIYCLIATTLYILLKPEDYVAPRSKPYSQTCGMTKPYIFE